MAVVAGVDRQELETKVKDMYRQVALAPQGPFRFEMGRTLAVRLGYEPADLDRVPAAAIYSLAGVGYHFQLADLRAGERAIGFAYPTGASDISYML